MMLHRNHGRSPLVTTRAPTGEEAPLVLDQHLLARLEKLAGAAGRSVSELADAVLRDFLEENERMLVAVDAGIAEADAGQLLDFDVVEAELRQKLSIMSGMSAEATRERSKR